MSNDKYKLPRECTLKDFVDISSLLASEMDEEAQDVEICVVLAAVLLITKEMVPLAIEHCATHPSKENVELIPRLVQLLGSSIETLTHLPRCRVTGDFEKQVREFQETDEESLEELMDKLFTPNEEGDE